ncbi:MAG: histidine phosphatase family protein [Acetobacteraceae bacterium]|nr:histidine phosphatase family protein [Acetobacteraceae bacterium]
MHQLLLLRHAKSSWDDPKLSDHERPLNARGRKAAAAIRVAMRELGLAPDIVLVSPALRTMQTLEILEPWDETPLIEPMDSLYLATAPQTLKLLQAVAETARSVLVIGHNPGMHELAMLLVGEQALRSANEPARRLAKGYPTASLAEFSVPGPWCRLDTGRARLVRFLAPKDLPETGAM